MKLLLANDDGTVIDSFEDLRREDCQSARSLTLLGVIDWIGRASRMPAAIDSPIADDEPLKLGNKMREIPLREDDRKTPESAEPCACGEPRYPGLGCCWKCYDRIAAKSDGEWREGRRV